MWDWGSPVAWAVFLVGASGSLVLLSLALQLLSKAVTGFVALGKRR